MSTTTPSSAPGPAAGAAAPGPAAAPVPIPVPAPTTGERALVLGGGGSTGNAWLIGVVAGLADAGVDVTTADLTVGTSAGATTAAQLAGSPVADLYAAVVAGAPPRRAPALGRDDRRERTRQAADQMARTAALIAASRDAGDMRRRLGAAALDLPAASDATAQERWRETVAARLPSTAWPRRALRLTAVDARTGEPVVLDAHSGVDLVDAVAASCAGGFAYGVGPDRFIDGGYRRNENADLAAGCRRVLVLSPLGGRTRTPREWGMQLDAQVAELRAQGSVVETLVPDGSAEGLVGPRAMDLTLRPAAARAGHAQGVDAADRVSRLWR